VHQTERRYARAQIGAVTSIHQNHAARQTDRTRPAHVFERNFRLGLEADVSGTPALRLRILSSTHSLGRYRRYATGVDSHGDWRATACNLAIVLLAELTAILTCHAN
jgi:hypothetical protein